MPSKPARRSFIAAHPAFAGGQDTPRAFLERCLELDPRDETAQFNLAETLVRQQKGARAIPLLQSLLSADAPNPA